MIFLDLNEVKGRTFPAGRTTKNVAGGSSPIQAEHFSLGLVVLDPDGGQVPWHSHEQEELYLILEGEGEMCVGEERCVLTAFQAVYVPPGVFHQITNIGDKSLRMIFCYGPAGDIDHWRQELQGTLPRAGVDVLPLPAGARPQRHK